MTSPNPMALEAKALEAIGNFDVGAYVEDYEFRGDDGDYVPSASERELLVDAISGVLHELHKTAKTVAALPLPAAGEGPTPQAQVMALIQEALALAPDAGLYLKIEVGAAK